MRPRFVGAGLVLVFAAAASACAGDAPADLRGTQNDAPAIVVDPPADGELQRRLAGIYAQLEGLDEVRVRVRDGVVHLTGTTGTIALERRAKELADRLEGVVAVDSDLVQESDLVARFAPTLRTLRRLGRAALVFLPQLLGAILVFVPFVLLSHLLRRWRRPLHVFGISRLSGSLLRSVLRGVLLLVGLMLALEVLGLLPHVGAVIGALGLLALAATFGFRDWIQNYLPGMLLGFHPPFAAGDLVQIGEREGRVVRITPRATILMTTDGEEVQIPNTLLFRESLINFSHHRERRLRFPMSLATSADLRRAQELGRQALLALEGVKDEPPPFMRTRTLGRDLIEVEFFAWVDQDRINFRTVESRARRGVFEALTRGGIPLPVDELVVQLPPSGLPEPPRAEWQEGDDAESRDRSFLETQLGRARSAPGERDLLEEGRRS